MKVFFLYEDKQWTNPPRYSDCDNIVKDLGLESLFTIAAKAVLLEDKRVVKVGRADPYLSQTLRSVMTAPLCTKEEVYYRHEMLKDAMKRPEFIDKLYSCVDDMLNQWNQMGRRETGKTIGRDSMARLFDDIKLLRLFATSLGEIRRMFAAEAYRLTARGFLKFYEDLCNEFSEEKEAAVLKVLEDISFFSNDFEHEKTLSLEALPHLVLGCNLALGLKCEGFVVEDVATEIRKLKKRNGITVQLQEYIHAQKAGAISYKKNLNLLSQVENMQYETVRYVVSSCSSFMSDFEGCFDQLRFQVGFLKAVNNLMQHVKRFSLPHCFPQVCAQDCMSFDDLKEMVMAIEQKRAPVGNTCRIQQRMLLVVTGANQGGKSTFLRSVGIAQVLLQCGMPVIASRFESGLFPQLFTHFTRREDSSMNSGRLDEELKRMSQIIDNLGPNSMVLLNESFATTTEKEGSVIAYDIIKALSQAGVKVLTVTHLLSFAKRIYEENKQGLRDQVEFFSAERTAEGKRTFRMVQHEPELTSFGMDLYERIIGP